MCDEKKLKNPRNPLLIPHKFDHEQHLMCRSRVYFKMTVRNERIPVTLGLDFELFVQSCPMNTLSEHWIL